LQLSFSCTIISIANNKNIVKGLEKFFSIKYERKGSGIAKKTTISKEQAKIIATAVVPNIKAYIEANSAEYEAWLKTQPMAEILPPKKLKNAMPQYSIQTFIF